MQLKWWRVQRSRNHSVFGRNTRVLSEAVESSLGPCKLDHGGLEPNAVAIYEEVMYRILPLIHSSQFFTYKFTYMFPWEIASIPMGFSWIGVHIYIYINIQYQSVPWESGTHVTWEKSMRFEVPKVPIMEINLMQKVPIKFSHQSLFAKKSQFFYFTLFRKSSQTFKLSRKQTIQNWKNHCE